MRLRYVGATVALLLLAGCGVGEAADPADNYRSELNHTADHMKELDGSGGNFWPAHLKMLRGEQPFPTEEPSCEAHTLEQLMLAPCDVP